jgi:hypothetical protein
VRTAPRGRRCKRVRVRRRVSKEGDTLQFLQGGGEDGSDPVSSETGPEDGSGGAREGIPKIPGSRNVCHVWAESC